MMEAGVTATEADGIRASLVRMGLADPSQDVALTPLTGGVSSMIVRADVGGRSLCVKRALSKLKVARDWEAPVERSNAEAAWIREATAIVPDAVPRLLGQDAASFAFAMAYLDPAEFPVWKAQLLAGVAETTTASAVATNLVAIHNATANRLDLAARFANHDSFFALRLDPYFVVAAEQHTDCKAALDQIVTRTAETRLALIHGDVSPKNILVGAKAPVLLDAECATYGDPAFDLAFCLNHLLLKCVWRPQAKADYVACYQAFLRNYLPAVAWEPVADIERRAGALLPAMLLARIDGKSPVEYITKESDRDTVRGFARQWLLGKPCASLSALGEAWKQYLT